VHGQVAGTKEKVFILDTFEMITQIWGRKTKDRYLSIGLFTNYRRKVTPVGEITEEGEGEHFEYKAP
jgi:hypothetical protein